MAYKMHLFTHPSPIHKPMPMLFRPMLIIMLFFGCMAANSNHHLGPAIKLLGTPLSNNNQLVKDYSITFDAFIEITPAFSPWQPLELPQSSDRPRHNFSAEPPLLTKSAWHRQNPSDWRRANSAQWIQQHQAREPEPTSLLLFSTFLILTWYHYRYKTSAN